MLSALLTASLLSAVPAVGDTLADFTVTDSEGKQAVLSELLKKGDVIVAFFPKAFTGGCTKQMEAFTRRFADVEAKGGTVLAVSSDKAETMKKFKESLKAQFRFIPDPDGKLISLFDVRTPLVGVAKRYNFVIGEGRKVKAVQAGSDAIEPSASITACELRKKTPATDAGQ
jgi:peroxiredoxin Q/BCP